MAIYRVKKAIHSEVQGQDWISLRNDVYDAKGRGGGSLLEVLKALYGTHVPWEVTHTDSEEMAVHAALVHTGARGRILYFGGDYHAHFSYLHDPQTDTIENTHQGPGDPVVLTDMFCAGHSMLHDGSVLVAGGQLPHPGGEEDEHKHGGMAGGGERHCYRYDPDSGWSERAMLRLDPDGNPESGGRWYPTLLTLANGLVLAVGGHPDIREIYPDPENQRHSNNLPERYDFAENAWTLLPGGLTAENPVWAFDYQRIHLLPDGRVFFSSNVRGANRTYDAMGDQFEEPTVALPPEGIYQGATSMAIFTSVLLPLRHEDGYTARVLLAGDHNSYLCDFGAESPAWQATPDREWNDPPRRNYAIATLLPNGDVFLSGGTAVLSGDGKLSQDGCVLEGEVFGPNLRPEDVPTWQTVAPAQVPRRYHGTALLMADGTVWTGGSNGTLDYADEHGLEEEAELRIEVYRPAYTEAVDRPTLHSVPDFLEPGEEFEVVYTSAHPIRDVVFLRNGSVTHGFNSDQRLITAEFEVLRNHRLRIEAPPNHNIAPPGIYMLWILDDQGSPCWEAKFLRLMEV